MADPQQENNKATEGKAIKLVPYPIINPELCKGCNRCVVACPQHVLSLESGVNKQGYHPVKYIGAGCIGCAMCYYNCPEIYAIEVFIPPKAPPAPKPQAAAPAATVDKAVAPQKSEPEKKSAPPLADGDAGQKQQS